MEVSRTDFIIGRIRSYKTFRYLSLQCLHALRLQDESDDTDPMPRLAVKLIPPVA